MKMKNYTLTQLFQMGLKEPNLKIGTEAYKGWVDRVELAECSRDWMEARSWIDEANKYSGN